VSLTVAETRSRSFVVAVIPETLARTTLGSRRAGDDVHLEADVLARYAARLLTVGDDVRRSGHEMR
jgi:riboflavin synthase